MGEDRLAAAIERLTEEIAALRVELAEVRGDRDIKPAKGRPPPPRPRRRMTAEQIERVAEQTLARSGRLDG